MGKFYGILFSLVLFGGILMSACTPTTPAPSSTPTNPPTQPSPPSQTPAPAKSNANPNMANPASVNCEQKGNRLEIRTAADGSQVGICIFPDGSQCEEWAYLRGECGQGTLAPSSANPRETVPAPRDTPAA